MYYTSVISILCTISCVFSAKSPNIVVILADDYGWNDVGFHGSVIRTPTLDKLAHDGVKLENYYVQPICTPTRSQLLSGRYQIHTGLQHGIIWAAQPNGLPLTNPTIADKLKEQGYATHMVGKWHIGFYKKEYTPNYRGFDTFFGYLTGSEDYYTHERCYGFNGHPEDTDHSEESGRTVCGVDLHENQDNYNATGKYSTELFAEKAEAIIRNHAKTKRDEPLFLYLPFQAVHSPLEAPQKYIDRYSNIRNKNRRTYAGMVSMMDEAVANVTNALKTTGLWEDTLLVFSTDNGGQILAGGNNWPLRGWKGSLWEGGMRGVGFVSGPVLSRDKTSIRDLIHVTDWYPTLVGLAGGNTSGLHLDGYNVWPTLRYGQPSPRKELLHNIDPMTMHSGKAMPNVTFDTRVRAAIRRENWKLITGNPGNSSWVPPPDSHDGLSLLQLSHQPDPETKNLWLFDLEKDPFEREDVSASNPAVVNLLLERLAYYNSTALPPHYPPEDPQAAPDKHGGWWVPWR